jgi:ATP/maltotriose-dependent transcriptional regulator MalT
MLWGRDHEMVRFGELLAELGNGHGSALLLRGEPGIGKTALLTALVSRCGNDIAVLWASGVQTEADLAFAALSDLLGPVLDGLPELPAPQADALAAALALGPPSPGDRLAVCVATVGLLSIAARARPVLVVVDDAQWLDAASRECIQFAARRAAGRVAFVLTARDPVHGEGDPGMPILEVGPLSIESARDVLDEVAPDVVAPVAAAVVDAAAGNPLALVELPATLTAGQRAGREPLDLPLPAGARIQEIVTRRTAALGFAARQLLLLVAADGERAWHLAAATIGTDEQVAAELERVAGAVAARRGFASAASALERAAELSPDRKEGARRTCAAGEAAAAAGQLTRALQFLDRAASAATDDGVRTRAEHLRGLLRLPRGEVVAALDILAELAGRLAVSQPRRAAPVLADAANTCTVLGRAGQALSFAEGAAQALKQDSAPAERAHVLAALGWVLVLCGELGRARRVLDEAERAAEELDILDPAVLSVITALNIRLPTGEFERSLHLGSMLADRARAAGALGALALPLIIVSDTAYRLGDWETCDDASAEVMQIVKETGQQLYLLNSLAIRARLAAASGQTEAGRLAGARAHALAEAQQIDSGRCYAHAALGFLELGVGQSAEAIRYLEGVAARAERGGMAEPTLIPWAPDLIEAYLRTGDTAQARGVLAVLERQVSRADTVVARALLARCVGMLADDYDAWFTDALAWDDRRPMPFERARTQLAHGRRLHRERRRAEARVQLRTALDGFERLEAEPWAAQARNELQAAGARRRSSAACDPATLSAQESRVAVVAARGGSTRDVATELFLAPKTVEFHLGQIYRKLGVRNRGQMIVALADDPGRVQPAGPGTGSE